jgi:hypothetical protein
MILRHSLTSLFLAFVCFLVDMISRSLSLISLLTFFHSFIIICYYEGICLHSDAPQTYTHTHTYIYIYGCPSLQCCLLQLTSLCERSVHLSLSLCLQNYDCVLIEISTTRKIISFDVVSTIVM